VNEIIFAEKYLDQILSGGTACVTDAGMAGELADDACGSTRLAGIIRPPATGFDGRINTGSGKNSPGLA
jgi:calcineurin-like phosphoesterase